MEPAAPVDLICASANPLLLDGLRHLERLGQFRIRGEARDVNALLASLKTCKPTILLLDLDLTAQESHIIQQCRLAHGDLKVMLVEGASVEPSRSLEIQNADAFVDRRQSMATLIKRLEELCGSC